MTDKTKYLFKKKWLTLPQFKDWLITIPGNPSRAKCKYCNCDFNAIHCDLKSHLNSIKHKNTIEQVLPSRSGNQSILTAYKPSLDNSKAEAKLCLYVCVHTSILCIDHLGELCINTFKDTTAKTLKIDNTRCSGIIKNILYPHFQSSLLKTVTEGFSKYSLLLDESNDISVIRLLGIVIMFYDNELKKRVSTFLALVPLEKCDAQLIVDSIKATLNRFHLPLQNLLGIGTDNTSFMMGVNNSVYTILKSEIPNLSLITCVCHSLQLCVSHAARECLPRNLEFMISETYNWFTRSALRQTQYKQLYSAINDDADPKKIVRACGTRWLSIEVAVTRILEQYVELKAHFNISRSSEKCFTAKMLYDMYNDKRNLAYLLFLKPILSEVQRVNKSFESNVADPTLLLENLNMLRSMLGSKIALPNTCLERVNNIKDHLDPKPYLGYQFEQKVNNLLSNKIIVHDEENEIRNRCKKFILKLYEQLQQRLPDNINILQDIALISVHNILKHSKKPIQPLLENLHYSNDVIKKITYQYDNIVFSKWNSINNTIEFWAEVNAFRDPSGKNPFNDLCHFALRILVLPISNAEVERVFSNLNIVKSKIRNRMSIDMVNAILSVKYGLKRHESCCYNYTLPDDMLIKIGRKQTYSTELIDFDLISEINV